MEELQGLLLKIQGKVDSFNSWAAKLREALKGQGDDRVGKLNLVAFFRNASSNIFKCCRISGFKSSVVGCG